MTAVVISDFDNTLVHSTIDFVGIRRDSIALWRGHHVTDQPAVYYQLLSIVQIMHYATIHDDNSDHALMPVAWRIVLDYERAGMQAATIEDGASEELEVLRGDGFRLAVLTNNARQATLEALHQFNLSNAFDLVLTRDEVAMKP